MYRTHHRALSASESYLGPMWWLVRRQTGDLVLFEASRLQLPIACCIALCRPGSKDESKHLTGQELERQTCTVARY